MRGQGGEITLPEGIDTFEVIRVGGATGMHPVGLMGGYIQVSDLPAIYKHFSDRLLEKLAEEAPDSPYDCDHIGAVEDALGLQATSIPEVDRG